MEIKARISDVDRRLLERISNITNEDPGVDDYNWVEVDTLLATLDSLEDSYKELENALEDKCQEFEDFKENHKPCDIGDNWNYYSTTISRLERECKKQYDFIKEKGLVEEYGKYQGQ